MPNIHWDAETKSSVDLKKCGSYRYFESPDADILCLSYATGLGPVATWVPGQPPPAEFLDPDSHFIAWNAAFERECWRTVMRRHGFPECPPLSRWTCAMAVAQQFGLPGGLDKASAAISTSDRKDRRGQFLIRRWCIPNKQGVFRSPADDPVGFEEFLAYNRSDVRTERAVLYAIPSPRLAPYERPIWELDQEINARGVKVNLPAAATIIAASQAWANKLDNEAKRITKGLSVTQRDAILKYLREQEGGDELASLARDDLERTLPVLTGDAKRVAEIRLALSRSSVSKFHAMLRGIGTDRRLRGMFNYYGAHTGRWSGRRVQLQNLPRTDASELVQSEHYPPRLSPIVSNPRGLALIGYDPMKTYSGLIRSTLIPEPGKRFFVGDFSQIELVVSCWLAGQTDVLEMHRSNSDIYRIRAAAFYGIRPEDVSKWQRQLWKQLVLGAGFGMGPARFRDYLRDNADIEISEAEAKQLIYAYRDSVPQITAFWRLLTAAMIQATERPGVRFQLGKLQFIVDRGWLAIRLPSGRGIFYRNPVVVGEGWRRNVVCEGRVFGGAWGAVRYWGGLILENVTQAAARDLLAEAALRVDPAYPIVLHAHDELVAETAETDPADFTRRMEHMPAWAEGLSIRVETHVSAHYRKF